MERHGLQCTVPSERRQALKGCVLCMTLQHAILKRQTVYKGNSSVFSRPLVEEGLTAERRAEILGLAAVHT